MVEIKPCPICGKTPKIKFSYDHCTVNIKCKPWLENPHFEENFYCLYQTDIPYAIRQWNEKVDEYNKVHS